MAKREAKGEGITATPPEAATTVAASTEMEDKSMKQFGPELRKDKFMSMFVPKRGFVLWKKDVLLQLSWRKLVGLPEEEYRYLGTSRL